MTDTRKKTNANGVAPFWSLPQEGVVSRKW